MTRYFVYFANYMRVCSGVSKMSSDLYTLGRMDQRWHWADSLDCCGWHAYCSILTQFVYYLAAQAQLGSQKSIDPNPELPCWVFVGSMGVGIGSGCIDRLNSKHGLNLDLVHLLIRWKMLTLMQPLHHFNFTSGILGYLSLA